MYIEEYFWMSKNTLPNIWYIIVLTSEYSELKLYTVTQYDCLFSI